MRFSKTCNVRGARYGRETHRAGHLLFSSALVLVLGSVFPVKSIANDPTTTWTGSVSSDWFNGSNWSAGSVPGSNDFAEIDTTDPNSTTITDSSTNGTAQVDLFLVSDTGTGTLNIDGAGALTVSDTMVIAQSGGTGTVTVSGSGSTLTIGEELNIADMGTGILTIADSGVVSVQGLQSLIMGEDKDAVAIINIGAASGDTAVSPGTLTLTNDIISIILAKQVSFVFNHTGTESDNYTFTSSISGTTGAATAEIRVESGYTVFSGDNSGYGETVVIDGGTMVVTGNLASNAITVGDSTTNSELIVKSAGNISLNGNLVIGNGSASAGSVTVSGSGATMNATGNFYVGNKGTGTLIVTSSGTASANDGSGTITVAHQSGSTGTLAVGAASGDTAADPGTISAAKIAFGSGTGTLLFNHTGTSSSPLDLAIPISGKGTIDAQSGYTALSGDNSSFSGTVTIDAATLAVTGNLKGSALNVGNTGTGAAMTISNEIEVDISGDATIGVAAGSSGSVTVSGATQSGSSVTASTLKASGNLVVGSSGTGTLIVNNSGAVSVDGGKGTLTIAEASGSTGTFVVGAESGQTALGTGTLSADSVAFGSGTGSVLFNHSDDSGSFGFSTPFKGGGTLSVEAGTTVLSANHKDFTGSTTIDGGTLSVSGTLPGNIAINSGGTLSVSGTVFGDIAVNDGGILGGTGTTTGTVTVSNGGSISPGGSVGTIQTQDVTFQSGSLYVIEIDTDGNVDLLKSGGTVILQGGTVSVSADSYSVDTSLTIVTADTAVSGTFSDDVSGGTTFIDYALSYDTTDVTLTQSVSQSFSSVAATANHRAVGSALDSLPTDHPVVQHTFGAMTETEARDIFGSLSGEVHASMQGALMNNDRAISGAVNRRLNDGSSDATQVFAYGSGQASNLENGAWITGYGGWNDIDATANTAAADNDYGGLVAGLDRDFGRHWRLGVVGAYGQTDLSQSSLDASSNAKSFSAGLYAGAIRDQIQVNLGGLASWHDIDSSRSVAVGSATQNLAASYDATSWQLFGEAGYRIERDRTQFEPFAGLSFTQLDTDGFTETGGSAALTAASSTENTTFSTLGLRMERNVTEKVRLQGMAGWRHAFGDVDPTTTFTLPGSTPFTVAGAPIAEDALVIEAGFEVEVSDGLTLGAGYDGQFGDGSTLNQIEGYLRLRF